MYATEDVGEKVKLTSYKVGLERLLVTERVIEEIHQPCSYEIIRAIKLKKNMCREGIELLQRKGANQNRNNDRRKTLELL